MRNVPTLLLVIASLLCSLCVPVDEIYQKLIGIGLSIAWFVITLHDLKEASNDDPDFFTAISFDSSVLKISFVVATAGLLTIGARISGFEPVMFSQVTKTVLLGCVLLLNISSIAVAVYTWRLLKAEARSEPSEVDPASEQF